MGGNPIRIFEFLPTCIPCESNLTASFITRGMFSCLRPILSSLCPVLSLWRGGHCFVIAPPWADPASNPCSASSWQLVFWPPTQNCYQIFSRGPCPDTQVTHHPHPIFSCEDAAQEVLMSVCPSVDKVENEQNDKTVQDSTRQYKTVQDRK